uniref:Uncharacterized protein n=1 Tax=Anguilla anguilla TaxID=7936 RepID=A0A0E9PEF6_ANGAN
MNCPTKPSDYSTPQCYWSGSADLSSRNELSLITTSSLC